MSKAGVQVGGAVGVAANDVQVGRGSVVVVVELGGEVGRGPAERDADVACSEGAAERREADAAGGAEEKDCFSLGWWGGGGHGGVGVGVDSAD